MQSLIALYCRQTWRLNNPAQLRQELSSSTVSLQANQFENLQYQMVVERERGKILTGPKLIPRMFAEANLVLSSEMFNDVMFQNIISASVLGNATDEAIRNRSNVSTLSVKDIIKFEFYCFINGYKALREWSEEVTNGIYDYFKILKDKYQKTFLGFMIAGILFGFLAISILIKFLMSIQRVNFKVLKLFGLIPHLEILMLTENTEKFSNEYIVKESLSKEMIQEAEENVKNDKKIQIKRFFKEQAANIEDEVPLVEDDSSPPFQRKGDKKKTFKSFKEKITTALVNFS